MNTFLRSTLLSILLAASGCTQTTQDLSDSFTLAIAGPQNNQISKQQIEEIPYASILVQKKDTPPALLVLAWVEGNSDSISKPAYMKWLSANKELFVTQSGRIVKTVNLPEKNLDRIESELPDPLTLGLNKNTTPKDWSFLISWSPDYHEQYPATSHFEVKQVEPRKLISGTRNLLHVVEYVSIPLINQELVNNYWLDPKSGEVVTSIQTPAPNMPSFTLTTAKPYINKEGDSL